MFAYVQGLVVLAFLVPQGAGVDGGLDLGHVANRVSRFAWADGGRRLLYAAYSPGAQEEDWAVYSAEIPGRRDGFASTWLGWGHVLLPSPDGQQVVFYYWHPGCWESGCGPWAVLMCSPVDGSLPAWSASEGAGGVPQAIAFDPSSSWVAFTIEAMTNESMAWGGLFSHAIGGGATLSLTEPPGQPLFARAGPPVISPDGSRVVYTWSHTFNRLQSVPIDRSLPPLGLTPTGYDSIWSYQVTPDSSTVVFVSAVYPSPNTLALYRVPIDGSAAPAQLAPPQSATAYVDRAFLLGPGGEDVFYLVRYPQADSLELWTVPLDPGRGNVPVRLSAKPVPGGGVAPAVPPFDGFEPVHEYRPQFALASGGARVVYRADQDLDEVFELYSVPSDGSAPAVKLNAPLAPGESVPVFGFRIDPAGTRVVYAAPDADGALRLWAVPIDASAPPLALGGPFAAGGSLWLSSRPDDGARFSFELTRDGERVVYVADQRADETSELFVALLDGSPARCLNVSLGPGGDVRSLGNQRPFALSPDGHRVAYLADEDADGVLALHVAYLRLPRARPARLRAVPASD